MVFRAVVFAIVLVSFPASSLAQIGPLNQNGPRPGGQSTWNSRIRNFNSISGSVFSADSRPAGNVRVELRDGNTGTLVSSAYTGIEGSFEFRQLAQGRYEVVAFSGVQQAQEQVEVNSMATSVNLRLPAAAVPANDGNGKRTVSVSQYKVPQAAREELRKARDASLKSKIEDAQRHLQKALQLDPNYADALTLQAILKLDAKDSEGAVNDLQRAIQSDGSYAIAYLVLGSAFNSQLKFDDALRVLERGQSLAPDAWQAYFEMGRAYVGKSDYEAALHQLDRAQSLAPQEYPNIRLIRAHALMRLTRYSDAIADLQTYLLKNPNGPEAEQARTMLEMAQASMTAAHE
jgi:tetratricopeptide (TPR) repeat protein